MSVDARLSGCEDVVAAVNRPVADLVPLWAGFGTAVELGPAPPSLYTNHVASPVDAGTWLLGVWSEARRGSAERWRFTALQMASFTYVNKSASAHDKYTSSLWMCGDFWGVQVQQWTYAPFHVVEQSGPRHSHWDISACLHFVESDFTPFIYFYVMWHV